MQNQESIPVPNYFSGKKRRKELPVKAVCRNCGTGLAGRYCHCCGQDLFKGTKRTLGDLVFHAVENILSIDNKLLGSMKYLLFRPGKLTKEYVNGRIIRYVHPTKLFWFISIVFFFLLAAGEENASSDTKNKNPETKETVAGIPANTVNRKNGTATPAPMPYVRFDGNAVNRKSGTATNDVEDKITGKAEEKYDRYEVDIIRANFLKYAPYASFLLIPFFALLLNLFFRRRELFYIDHLVFAIHFHAFIFFLFTLHLIVTWIFPGSGFGLRIHLCISLLYLISAIWVFYRPGLKTLLFKIMAIFIFYGIAIISTIILLFIMAVKPGKLDDVINDLLACTAIL
jgi:hypothetical protein